MPLRHLVVTPLPNGRFGNTAFLSVHLSPRLREDGVLSDYPDWGDWGTFVTAAPLQFRVLANGLQRPASVVSPAVDRRVWRAVFGNPPDTVPVQRFTFTDRRDIDLRSIDSGHLSDVLMALVRAVAELGGDATRAEIQAAAGDLFALLPDAQRYYEPTGNGNHPPPPSTEFHGQLGPLHAHPFLQRVLGLVYDLEVTLPGGPVTEIAVRTNWPVKAGTPLRDEVPMRVAVDPGFKAVANQPEYRTADWLALGGKNYAVAQLDLINAVAQVTHLRDDLATAPDVGSTMEVPALLESGLSVIHGDLADVLRSRLRRQRTVENGIDQFITGRTNQTPILFAEDITHGYRYDVEDRSAPGFRSLHHRQVPTGYKFPRDKDLTITPPPDEGWGSIALSTDGSEVRPDLPTAVIYEVEDGPDVPKAETIDDTAWRVDDHLMTWGGWSLSTPRVGSSTTGAGEVGPRQPNRPLLNQPTQLVVDYSHVSGTLPKLRYGHSYALRARCVDLAGNGPQPDDTPPAHAESPAVRYGRLAPLSPPLVIRRASRADPGVGDITDVLVIKSELEDPDVDIAPTDRLLFPPRISQSRLERHNLPNGGNDPAAHTALAWRDARSIADQTIVDAETRELVAGEDVDGDGQVTPGPTQPPVGYLADPVAAAVACHSLPGADPAAPPQLVPYGTWPDLAAVQLELRAGNGPPAVAPQQNLVRVRLPKGTVAAAELSHAPDPDLLSHMGLAPLTDPTDTLNGLNRSISGRRRVGFVHAVRVPLAAPAFAPDMTFSRTAVGQTTVGITGTLGLHRRTTDHVVLRARWVDPIDTPGTPAPREQVQRRVVKDLHLPFDGPPRQEDLSDLSLELGDTKRRLVTIGAEAFCRFSRYFTERLDFSAPDSGEQLLDDRGVAPLSVVLTTDPAGTGRYERGRHFDVDRSGVLTILDGGAIPSGTSCRAEFLPLPVSRLSSEALQGKQFQFDVPASASPALPRVQAVLPAFDRRGTATDEQISMRHDGRVLRLHLERPWFTSGLGELLGVALDPASATTPVLTRWARDPLVAGPGVTLLPGVDDFTAATERAAEVDGRFDVAGHEVAFDAARQLWIADIAVNVRFAYRPFVVLAVCRWQPLALDGQHLSGTVELDPIRLGATRQITITRLLGHRVEVRLTGNDNLNVVTAILQEASADIADPDLRWHDVDSVELKRSGTTALATHSGMVDIPLTGKERRLIIEDAEPTAVEQDGVRTAETTIAYREAIKLPTDW